MTGRLLHDSRRYEETVVAGAVDAKLDIWMGMPHGFVTSVFGFNPPRGAQGKWSISNRAAGKQGQMKRREARSVGHRRPRHQSSDRIGIGRTRRAEQAVGD